MILRTTILSLGVLALAELARAGGPATVNAEYLLDNPELNPISISFGEFGYTNEEGDFVGLVGQRIRSATAVFTFEPLIPRLSEGGGDPLRPENLLIEMLVPVIPDDPNVVPVFSVRGEDLLLINTPDGPLYTYDFFTTEFNGIVRPGRFSIDITSEDDDGNPVSIFGGLVDQSGFYFEVTIPEPTTLGLLATTALLLSRRRGR